MHGSKKLIEMPYPLAPSKLLPLLGMRIARVSTVPFFVVTQLKNQLVMLGELGAQVAVVTSDGPGMDMLARQRGIRCEMVDIPRAISPYRDCLALIRLYLFFRRNRTQVAHSTTPKAGLLTAISAFLAGVPVRLHTFTGQPWVNIRGVKGWLARTSDMLVGRLNTRCYADSASQRQFLIDHRILNADRLFVIGAGSLAGVDIKRFDNSRFPHSDCVSMRRSLGIAECVPVLLFVGRITPEKGVRELLKAFGILKAASSKAHLIFVGPFDDGSGVPGIISHNELAQYSDIHIVGYSERPEAFMAIADVLCLPSYREGFGTVVIEAAAMGVPTVGTDIYGLTDAIVHEETGFLVPIKNAKALANAISLLLEDDALRIRMGKAAKQRAQALFNADFVNIQVAEEYRSLLVGMV
jgi:glycosyltransferase involved in cell wall biosynthesis